MSVTLKMSAFVKNSIRAIWSCFYSCFLYLCTKGSLTLIEKANFCNSVYHIPLFSLSKQVAAHDKIPYFFFQCVPQTVIFYLTLHIFLFLVDLGGTNLRIEAKVPLLLIFLYISCLVSQTFWGTYADILRDITENPYWPKGKVNNYPAFTLATKIWSKKPNRTCG